MGFLETESLALKVHSFELTHLNNKFDYQFCRWRLHVSGLEPTSSIVCEDTNDGERRKTMLAKHKRWRKETNDGGKTQTMAKGDKRWWQNANDGCKTQMMAAKRKRWRYKTNDGESGYKRW